MRELIQDKWRQEEVPIMDGVLYSDGRIVLFSYESVEHRGERGLHVVINGETTLADFLARDPDMWTSIIEMDSVTWDGGGLRILSGGCGFGSDGFVAAIRLPDEQLLWVAVSQRSNPFRALDRGDGYVLATTELGQVWRFSLPYPESVAAGWPD